LLKVDIKIAIKSKKYFVKVENLVYGIGDVEIYKNN